MPDITRETSLRELKLDDRQFFNGRELNDLEGNGIKNVGAFLDRVAMLEKKARPEVPIDGLGAMAKHMGIGRAELMRKRDIIKGMFPFEEKLAEAPGRIT